jgi:hypothetical protein
MTEKASLYATAIQCSSLWKGESGLVYNSFYLTSLGYGTPATPLIQQECYGIQKPVAYAFIPKIGIRRKPSRGVIFRTRNTASWEWIILLLINGIVICNT